MGGGGGVYDTVTSECLVGDVVRSGSLQGRVFRGTGVHAWLH